MSKKKKDTSIKKTRFERFKIFMKNPKPRPIPEFKFTFSIPYLSSISRIIAGILFMISAMVTILSLTAINSLLLLIIFIPNSIIMFDYLMVTRKKSKKM